MESPISIANYFIQKSFDTGVEITPMKVLKLVYIAHGWNLGLNGTPLINEAVQAWKYGPVVESIYKEFRTYGSSQITTLGTYFAIESFSDITPVLTDNNNSILLDKVWEVYKNYNGLQLSALTHQPGTPWDIVWNKMNANRATALIISNEIIKAHYKAKILDNAKSSNSTPAF